MNRIIHSLKLGKSFKKKIFFSNDLKRSLFQAFLQAQIGKTYITPELLLYGLLSQPNSLAANIISTTLIQFTNNKSLTPNFINNRILQLNKQEQEQNQDFSGQIWKENALTPWFTPQLKDIIKRSINVTLEGQNKFIILTTKQVIFELLNQESIRDLLRQLVS